MTRNHRLGSAKLDADRQPIAAGPRTDRAGIGPYYVRSRRAGERVMASVSRFLINKLRLKVNEAKSAVARPEERKFLGFSIANDGSERRIAPKALAKFKVQIRDMIRRTRGISLPQMVKDLAPYLLGWRGYFGFCQTPRVLTNLQAWIQPNTRLRRELRAKMAGFPSVRTPAMASKTRLHLRRQPRNQLDIEIPIQVLALCAPTRGTISGDAVGAEATPEALTSNGTTGCTDDVMRDHGSGRIPF
jgi:Group II intron, maturase-specific domain